MKIYFGHSREFNFKDELYSPVRESRINSEHEIIFPHETDAVLVSRDIIKTSDLMIAEVSYPAIGLGIELGWADAFGCPIICIYRKGSKTSGSLKIICEKFIEYTDKKDLIEKLENALSVNQFA